jgi:hypothetical protein
LHSGIVYPSERDPTQLITALGRLRRHGRIEAQRVRIRFRAAVHDEPLRRLAEQHGVGDIVQTMPPLPYREALAEMIRADALLAMQGANCNEQIPAKIYEYLRAKRPILCLADPAGDTATVLRNAGVEAIAKLESGDAIEATLPAFLRAVAEGTGSLVTADAVRGASREQRSTALAELIRSVT